MHPVFYYIIVFLVLGGVGMAIGSRKAEPAIRRQRWTKYYMYIFITGTIITGIFCHFFSWLAGLVVLAAWIELSRVNMRRQVVRSAAIWSSVVFLLIAAAFMLFTFTFNEPFILFIYFQVLVFDGFCQVSGQLFGRHRIAPGISPAKTWEGLAGGWLAGIAAALLAAGWLKTEMNSLYIGLFSGSFTGFVAFMGDLLASYYKRKAQVKDYSNWLPGQGGFLDRFDSFLVTGAMYYLLYIVIFKSAFSTFIK